MNKEDSHLRQTANVQRDKIPASAKPWYADESNLRAVIHLLIIAAIVLFNTWLFAGCTPTMANNGTIGAWSSPLGVTQAQPLIGTPVNALGAGGPVGRVAGMGGAGMIVLPPSAGQSMLRGSGFDAATHPAIYAQASAERPMIVGGDDGGPVGGTPPAAAPATRAASEARVTRLAGIVARHQTQIERLMHHRRGRNDRDGDGRPAAPTATTTSAATTTPTTAAVPNDLVIDWGDPS